ncbi:MAG: RNA methyltransferase [Gloeomargarita sp. SKYG116]|nr:RNA methyltransferase [Gloeomargarita sp. SKYG116]MCS7225593.1 RNA methyltransferase [Gloeomargarita sp. SKYB31]MDW8400905.1 RNA methyltransferase [Gloeomargarita sp. SKYGB_i_bin116]
MVVITSRRHPLVHRIRSLHTTKGRREAGEFLLEGTHLLTEALQQGIPLKSICYTLAWAERHPDVLHQLPPAVAQPVSPQVLDALATTVNPDGVVAIAPIPTAEPALRVGWLHLLGYRLQDPGNVGTLIRTAAAVGVTQLWLTDDSVDPYHPKVLRSAAGQWFRCPPHVCADPLAVLRFYQQKQVQIVATDAQGELVYWQVDWRRPTLLLLGNESQGLPAQWLAAAEQVVRIPQQPGVESLNVAIAAAVCLYEAWRQRWTS